MEQDNKVIVLVDMDCFYCQVEEKVDPELKGKPIAVVQYNPWKGGGIIAVNYLARAKGVTRGMRGDEAKEKCPDIQLPSVPCLRGKADISKYREAGKEVAKVLQRFTSLLERASIDEAYLDITTPVQQRLNELSVTDVNINMMPNSYALGYDSVNEFLEDVINGGCSSIDFDFENARQLLIGAVIVSEIRAAVYKETGYRCSAGIAHNKILAKLVCGMNKPNKQTVLPKHSVNILYKTLPVKKVKNLGGKFGDTVCEILNIKNMSELQKFTERELQIKFDEKNGSWLYNIARGIDTEPVQARFNPKSIGCCKQLRGKSAVLDLVSLKKWLEDLGAEIEDRLEKDTLENNRTPKQMVVSFSTQLPDGRDCSSSRSYNFVSEDELNSELLSNKALDLILESTEGNKSIGGEQNRILNAPIKFLGISVGKFEDNSEVKKTKKIVDYFTAGASKDPSNNNDRSTENVKGERKKNSLMLSFLQICSKVKDSEIGSTESTKNEIYSKTSNIIREPMAGVMCQTTVKSLSSSLEKQESFFAKFLHKKNENETHKESVSEPKTVIRYHDANDDGIDMIRPITPKCDVLPCGDDSNDTNCSDSTINNEIDKSISLFDDDPEDVERVRNIRQLLDKTSAIATQETCEQISNRKESPGGKLEVITSDKHNEFVICLQCGKRLAVDEYETHIDYHFALKIRDEERLQLRKEKSQLTIKKNKKVAEEQNVKKQSVSSLLNFLVKVDDSIPTETCTSCSKKIPLNKFAEHLDFHEAQKLNLELNKNNTSKNVVPNVKRKRKSASPINSIKIPCKSIDSFFR